MLLHQVIQDLTPAKIQGPLDTQIVGITYDSRRVLPGMIFVAIPGQHHDGHNFINNAIDRGATAVICEQNGTLPLRATKIKVPDAREALARTAAAFYQHPSAKLKVIGITGTNGKTTVAFILKKILETAGIKTGLIGTIQYQIGDRIIPAQRTTPEALDLQQMLAQMVQAHCQACVMEVSSHALQQKRVLGIQFDVAIFTNLTQDHLDYHGTIENYFEAKKILFAALRQSTKTTGAVINIDDPFGNRLSRETVATVQLTYGLNRAAHFHASNLLLSSQGTRMRINTPNASFTCQFPLIGRHNVYNALAATGAASVLGIPTDRIRAALDSMNLVPGRLQTVNCGQPFAVYVDYAHTQDALQNVLTTLRELTPGKLLLTFGCGGNRDPGKRPQMGQTAARLADFTIITSDNPRKENPADIAAQIESGFRQTATTNYSVELDRRRAIDDLLRRAQPNDTVLIAGKGHETYQEFENTIVPFDDRLYAAETLELLGWLPQNPSPLHS